MVRVKMHFLRLVWLFGLAAPLAVAAPAAPREAVPVTYADTKRVGVSVSADTPELTLLMQRAFSIHGAFEVVPEGQAQYALRFDSAGGGVSVTVTPKIAGGAAFSATAPGPDKREDAYRAGDAVVEKITGRPGIFAGKLAFMSQRTGAREIFSSDLLGQEVFQLTTDKSTSLYPRWSPDGKKLLYTGYYKSGFPDIILYDVKTHLGRVFAGFRGTNTGGTFSPDSQRVAMILSATGNSELYVCDASGGNRQQLTKPTASRGGPEVKTSPTWSPDGKQIIFAFDNQSAPLLYQVSSTGGAMRPVPTRVYAYSADPAWNPRDADLVAFMTLADGAYRIATFSFKEGRTTIYTVGSEPCWANDGRHIIFTRHVSGKDQLYLLDTETRKESPLTSLGASQASFVYLK